ncbi:MAG: RNA polymerase sigma factor [Bacteroidales bacterium]|nr:RNA polymerase sigma factor [Bacteroidales bacterium]
MADYSDKELLALFRDDESKNYSFNLIVRKYQERLYWHIRKMVGFHEDADDVMQNTFLKVWKGLESFREDSQLYTWLYRVATNEALTFLKKKKTRYFISTDDDESHVQNKLESDVYFEGDELEKKLHKALAKLPDKQKLVFNMKYFDNIKYEDMSEILDTSVGALKASYHHAVKKLEKYLLED